MKKILLLIILSTSILFTVFSQYTDSNNKITQSEALYICTRKLKSINAYEDRYGEGLNGPL